MDSIRNRTKRCGAVSALMGALLLVVVCQECNRVEAFVPPFQVGNQKSPFLMKQNIISVRKTTCRCYSGSSFYDDFDNDDEDDDDDMIDVDSLGDWRDFRRNLAKSIPQDDEDDIQEIATVRTSGSKENEELLTSQSKELGEEYKNGVWAHVVSTVSCYFFVNDLRLSRDIEETVSSSHAALYFHTHTHTQNAPVARSWWSHCSNAN